MTPVMQVRDNDCFAACIASLLELPLGAVPNHPASGYLGQIEKMQRWLRRLGWNYIEMRADSGRMPWVVMGAPAHVILGVRIRKCGNLHAMIGVATRRQIRVVHDPSPVQWKRGQYSMDSVAFLVPAAAYQCR